MALLSCNVLAGLLSPFGEAAVRATPLPETSDAADAEVRSASTEEQALVQAEESGESVEVASLRGETREVFATPEGELEAREHLRPVWTRVAGEWQAIDTDVALTSDGVVAAKAVTVDLEFSGGGSGPLVRMVRAGRELELSWPGELPSPRLEGDTATYPEVLPGVDLRMGAQEDGFTQLLVVKSAEAAASAELAELRWELDAVGMEVRETAGGGLEAVDEGAGSAVFEAPQPMMWDSSSGPEETRPDGDVVSESEWEGEPGAGESGKLAPVDVEVPAGGDELVLTPDTHVLKGDDPGEACHASTFEDSWCKQAWRWNLDYAVDRHGNAIAYYYDQETNSYGRNLKATSNTRYVRGGTLDRVEYGLRSDSVYDTEALARVDLTSAERCLPNSLTDCESIETDAEYWYDTPWDLNCEADEDCDRGRYAPTFFTTKRLTQVTTQTWDGGAYRDVDSWKLTHRWGMADTDYQLELDSIQRTGHTASDAVTLPKTTFAYTQLANRLDKTGDGYAPFIKDRLSTVSDESGGQIDVGYSDEACAWDNLPTPQTNTTRCYPQFIGGSTTDDPERQWFTKYVVTDVTATDRTGGAPDQVTRYDYLGGAAWHYDDDDGLTEEKFKTWSQWRGYGHVRVRTGGQGGTAALKTQEDTSYLRGMHGDRKDPSGGTKSVSVTLDEGEGEPITDHASAAGFAYKTVSYSGPGGKVLAKTINRPWHHETARKVRDWGTVTADLTGTGQTRSFTSLDNGAGTDWRITSTVTTHDTVAGRVTQVDDYGDNTTATDNLCTRTTYATNTEANILTLPYWVETVATSCGADTRRPEHVVSDIRTAYDGGDYGAAPTKGDPTTSATLKEHDGATAVYLESGATYDAYGRQTTGTDLTADLTVTASGALTRTPRDDGRTTTTQRSPTTGFPTTTKVTTPPATAGDATTAQTTTTTHDTRRGLPLTQTDTNGKVTTFAYDALGRSQKVWLPDRPTHLTPTYQFTYLITEGKPVAVATATLGNRGAQRTSYALYDGFLRPRQSQEPGPDGGRLLTDTFYDERGMAAKEFATYYADGPPIASLFLPDDALTVETQSRYTYDGLGRQTEARQIAGNGDGGTVLGITRTIHGGDRTTVIPPEGGTATTTLTDARGRTTELRQHHERTAGATFDTTRYTYTPGGELARLTDPSGVAWNYTYDLLGHQTTAADPDKGTTTSTYDDRGQLTSTTDARGTTLTHVYDNLGRPTELREGPATGELRAKWVYDTISGAQGHLAESTRYQDGEAYTTKVVAYDQRYRALRTSVTIPDSEGPLAGTYLSTIGYNVSGLVQGVSYPKAGGYQERAPSTPTMTPPCAPSRSSAPRG